jgi:hypothetical protein
MKHPGHTYGGFVSAISERGMTHSVSGSTSKSFYPLGDIVDCYQDVLAAFRVWEWSHEIDTPDIKDVDLEVRSQRHCISCIDIPMLLTSTAASNK